MSDGKIIGMQEGSGRILTPEQLKKQECKMKINQICNKYGMVLVPVVQIIGSNMTTSVELADIVSPVGTGATENTPADPGDGS